MCQNYKFSINLIVSLPWSQRFSFAEKREERREKRKEREIEKKKRWEPPWGFLSPLLSLQLFAVSLYVPVSWPPRLHHMQILLLVRRTFVPFHYRPKASLCQEVPQSLRWKSPFFPAHIGTLFKAKYIVHRPLTANPTWRSRGSYATS